MEERLDRIILSLRRNHENWCTSDDITGVHMATVFYRILTHKHCDITVYIKSPMLALNDYAELYVDGQRIKGIPYEKLTELRKAAVNTYKCKMLRRAERERLEKAKESEPFLMSIDRCINL